MSLHSALQRANPNSLADNLRLLGLGNLCSSVMLTRNKFSFDAAGASASHVATLDAMALDPKIKALAVTRATVRAGAVTGELAPQAFGATPATTQIAVAPNGDIVALATDAITDCDVHFLAVACEEVVLELACDPATGIVLIPTAWKDRGVVYLHKAEALTGTVTGQKRILVPGAVNPATPQCRLSVAKDAVHFTVADAITKVRVTFSVHAKENVYDELLKAETTV